MTKSEYNTLKAEIIKQYGEPVWDMSSPVNESAVKLLELKNNYNKEKLELEKTKQLAKDIGRIVIPNDVEEMPIPEELLKDSWLTPFDSDGKRIVREWIKDIKQKPRHLAETLDLDIKTVRSVLSSEAFKLLRGNLALAYKTLLPLEASNALRRCLHSKDEKIAFQALKLVLLDSGMYKGEQTDVTLHKPKEVILDKETEEKLKKLGDQVLGLNNPES